MAAYGALGLVRARRLAKVADLACALSVEALQGSRESFMPQIHERRPLKGQIDSAHNLYRLLDGSAVIEAHRWCDKVQDAYSLRCAPQVHGASRDLLDYVDYTVSVELNAATDNPLVLVEDELLVSNGNFHGQPVAFALDALAMAVAELGSISERRTERLVNPNLSDGLPAFLTTDGGLNSGFMIPQYVAAALVSENKVLAHPASVDTIPTSAGQEDHVSMGNAVGPEGVDGARQRRADACDRAARRRAGRRVPRAAAARRRGPRGACVRPPAVSAARGRPAALAGHRARRGRDSRRVGPRGHRGRGGGAAMTRFERRRETRKRIKRSTDVIPVPNHPYRDSAIFYGVLAAILLGVTYWTGGGMWRAVIVAVGFFVLATAFSWYRFRSKLAEREQEGSR